MTITRQSLERVWVLIAVIYGIFRCLVVWHFLETYGVRPLVYGVIELLSSLGYGIYTSRLVMAAIDGKLSRRKDLVVGTIISFILPDVYIFLSIGRMPSSVLRIVLTVALSTAVIAVLALFYRTKAARVESMRT